MMLEHEAEKILEKMTVEEMKQAAKIGIMLSLELTQKGIQAIKKAMKGENNNG